MERALRRGGRATKASAEAGWRRWPGSPLLAAVLALLFACGAPQEVVPTQAAPAAKPRNSSSGTPCIEEGAAGDPERGAAPRVGGTEGRRKAEGPRVLELPLEGFFPVLVVRPSGEGPFPVVIATHGAGGLAEHHCSYWWEQLDGHHLLACPRGRPLHRGDPARGFYYPNHLELGREIAKTIAALGERFEGSLTREWTFAGYSQGATMGALALPEFVPPFTRGIFIEGGNESWTIGRISEMQKAGLSKVLLACGRESCVRHARSAAGAMDRGGIQVELALAPGAGHTYLGGVELEVRRQLRWLFD